MSAVRARRGAPRRARGIVTLALLVVVLLILAGWMIFNAMADNPRLAAESRSTVVLGQARDALIGHARTRWCLAPSGPVVNQLPCPDAGASEGNAPATCAAVATGRLPWRTLGLPPLRDAAGECLWYERTAAGARVIAPGAAMAGQARPAIAGAPVCGGDYAAAAYVEAAGNDIALSISAADLALPVACP